MDSSRLRTGEIVAGIGGVAMFVFLFFDWFSGAPELSGNAVTGATLTRPGISGWDALVDLPGFLIILSAVSGIALAYLAAAGQRVNLPVQRGAVTAYLGGLAVLLILWRMFAGSPTLKIGVFLGLAAAVAITAGAVMALREDGYQLLVSVPGGRTRAAAASAPPATPATAPTEEVPASAGAGSSSRTSGRTRSSGSTATKRPAARKPKASGSRSKSSSASKSGSRSKSSSARSKSSGSRSKSSRSSATKKRTSSSAKGRSSSSRSGGKKSSGGRKRSSGGRK